MSVVRVTNIQVHNNPASFVDPFRFEITFEASQALEDDLEWRLTYVGSADSEAYDQVLDSVLVGPVPSGVNKFELEAPAPDSSRIPAQDLLGVTVVLLECLYRDKVFVRVGYFVNNEDPDMAAAADAAAAAAAAAAANASTATTATQQGAASAVSQNAGVQEEVLLDEEEDEDEDEEEEEEENKKRAKLEADGEEEEEGEASLEAPLPPVIMPRPNLQPKEIRRTIRWDEPRITRFAIDWDNNIVTGGGGA